MAPDWLACFLCPRCWVGVEAGEPILAVFAAGAFFSGDGAGVLSVCAKAGCAVIARASRETQAKAFVAAMRLPLGC